MTQKTDSFTATSTWTCPANVSTVQVECWGAGGTGGSANVASGAGGGAAGGCYVITKKYPVVAGTVYTVTVGTGQAATTPTSDNTAPSGGDTWFDSTSGVVAKGGAGGQNRSTAGNGAAGTGSTTGCIGDSAFAGGNGAAGVSTTVGGGGGGGAGSTGAGGNAATSTGGTGTTVGGGNGSNGVNAASATAASNAGGGGGGARASGGTLRSGGKGGNGRVDITYEPNAITQTVVQASAVSTSNW